MLICLSVHQQVLRDCRGFISSQGHKLRCLAVRVLLQFNNCVVVLVDFHPSVQIREYSTLAQLLVCRLHRISEQIIYSTKGRSEESRVFSSERKDFGNRTLWFILRDRDLFPVYSLGLNYCVSPVGRNVSLLGAVVDDFMALTESFLDGISRQSSWVSVVYNQLIDLHILYLLGYHPGKQSSTFDMIPFVDHDHFIHQYFLPLEYAIFIPVFAGVTLLSLLSLFVGSVMLKSKKKKA
ncbi:Dolichol-phosphate mannose synthase subunit 2 [Linum perenne]